jgi:hypothetical protein
MGRPHKWYRRLVAEEPIAVHGREREPEGLVGHYDATLVGGHQFTDCENGQTDQAGKSPAHYSLGSEHAGAEEVAEADRDDATDIDRDPYNRRQILMVVHVAKPPGITETRHLIDAFVEEGLLSRFGRGVAEQKIPQAPFVFGRAMEPAIRHIVPFAMHYAERIGVQRVLEFGADRFVETLG